MKHTHLFSLTLLAAILVGGAHTARADHRDTNRLLAHPYANINDAYAFVDPNEPSKVVLAMTVNGFTVAGLNPIFGPDCLYQFKIDNTGDFVEDLVIQIRFDKPVGSPFSPTQGFTVIGPIKPPRVGAVNRVAKTKEVPITGTIVNVPVTNPAAGVPVNTFTTGANGVRVFCGLRDDAFTFDEIFVRNILRGLLVAPVPPNTRNPGIDFYARMNCSTIAVELPSAMLTGALVNSLGHKQLNIWATTSLPVAVTRSLRVPAKGEPPAPREVRAASYVQHDRAALPCVSTFLISEEDKDAFSGGQPKDDVKFYSVPAKALIQKMQIDPSSPAAIGATDKLIAIRFPDVLSLDVTSTAGFDAIDFSGAVPKPGNARRPQDDVISFELGLLTVGVVTNEGIPGSNGRIGGNDAAFLPGFPFFAAPFVPTQPVPARN